MQEFRCRYKRFESNVYPVIRARSAVFGVYVPSSGMLFRQIYCVPLAFFDSILDGKSIYDRLFSSHKYLLFPKKRNFKQGQCSKCHLRGNLLCRCSGYGYCLRVLQDAGSFDTPRIHAAPVLFSNFLPTGFYGAGGQNRTGANRFGELFHPTQAPNQQ